MSALVRAIDSRCSGWPSSDVGERGHVRRERRDVRVEAGVGGHDERDGGGQDALAVALAHVRGEALTGLGRADDEEAQRDRVEGGRAPLDQVVDRGDLLVADLVGR